MSAVKKTRTASPDNRKISSNIGDVASKTRVRFGDVAFMNLNITNQMTKARCELNNGTVYAVIQDGQVVAPSDEKIGDYKEVDILFDYTDRFAILMGDVEKMKQEAAVMKDRIIQLENNAVQLKKEFDQSVVDGESNQAIHELSNYISPCRLFIARKAGYSSWDDLYSCIKS